MEQKSVKLLEPVEVLAKTLKLKNEGYRFVAISCTKIEEGLEITYSFDKDYELENLRIVVKDDDEIESVSCFFTSAFLYENEMKELFGIRVRNILLDYDDNFYKKAKKTPFNERKENE